jgi:hypothetical protein
MNDEKPSLFHKAVDSLRVYIHKFGPEIPSSIFVKVEFIFSLTYVRHAGYIWVVLFVAAREGMKDEKTL